MEPGGSAHFVAMVPLRRLQTDVLVIGAGIAGLRAALAAHTGGASVLVVAKGPAASPGVIGFNAPVGSQDTPRQYFVDTWNGGLGLGAPELARLLTTHAVDAVTDLEALGIAFDRQGTGYHLLKPLGCSQPRLVHEKNHTGRQSMRLMRQALERTGARIRPGVTVLALLKAGGGVNGVLAADQRTRELLLIHAGAVVLATGGGGGIYADGTYPARLVGDGYALAYRAGAKLLDMEFVQFEPCHCLFPKRIGLSTTLLAHGGQLRNAQGQRFVLKEFPGGEGDAPKDALARLIALELRAGRGLKHGGVCCDLRGVPARVITEEHGAYFRLFLKHGIDLRRDLIEVGPAPHTFLGGVAISRRCKSGVPGLFAAGEVVGGLHGANRLGGNAGSECYVFGAVAGTGAARWSRSHRAALAPREVTQAKALARTLSANGRRRDWDATAAEIRRLMTANVGVVRDESGLGLAAAQLARIEQAVEAHPVTSLPDLIARAEIRNMILTGLLVVEGARRRNESRGVHYRSDFPQRDDTRWRKSIGFVRRHGRLAVTVRDRRKEPA